MSSAAHHQAHYGLSPMKLRQRLQRSEARQQLSDARIAHERATINDDTVAIYAARAKIVHALQRLRDIK